MEINDIKKTRWNFIGLASEEKPVPETSPDVVNGSTFYEVDTCKLFFWCDGFWYEKTAGVLTNIEKEIKW